MHVVYCHLTVARQYAELCLPQNNRYTAGEPKNLPDLYFGPNGVNLGGILVRDFTEHACDLPCDRRNVHAARSIRVHLAHDSLMQPTHSRAACFATFIDFGVDCLNLSIFLQAWEFCLMHWVEVRRWQDYKNFGSVNQDPIFKGNSVPNPEMGYPGYVLQAQNFNDQCLCNVLTGLQAAVALLSTSSSSSRSSMCCGVLCQQQLLICFACPLQRHL